MLTKAKGIFSFTGHVEHVACCVYVHVQGISQAHNAADNEVMVSEVQGLHHH